MGAKKAWSKEEIKLLKAVYPIEGKEITKEVLERHGFKRSHSAITNRCHKLKIGFQFNRVDLNTVNPYAMKIIRKYGESVSAETIAAHLQSMGQGVYTAEQVEYVNNRVKIK